MRAQQEGYSSKSTIDRPPRDSDGDQEAMFDDETKATTEEDLKADPIVAEYQVDLTVKLKRDGQKAVVIPLIVGELYADRVLEVLELALKSRRNQQIIKAVLDLPEQQVF